MLNEGFFSWWGSFFAGASLCVRIYLPARALATELAEAFVLY
jgi:hypothetical protein